MGLYAPNGAKEPFFLKLQQKLNDNPYDQVILMGDFNAVADAQLDKSVKRKGGVLLKIFFEITEQAHLEDTWRQKNGNMRDYTFYSTSKNSWSRLDMIWSSRSLFSLIKKVDILPKIMSDHNPVVCTFKSRKRLNRWRLNEELLDNNENLTYIQNEIKFVLNIIGMGRLKIARYGMHSRLF